MTLVDPVRPPRLADAVAQHIELLILEGALRPGERLIGERELAEKLEVSRPSLREALAQLEKRGLLVTSRAGTFVADFLAPITGPFVALLGASDRMTDDYFEYREAVEARAARLAARRATEHDKKALAASLEEMRKAHGLDDPTAEAASDVAFHRTIYEAAHNLVILHVMRAFSELSQRDIFYSRRQLYDRPGVRARLLAEHEAIARAILDGDGEGAEAAAVAHLSATVETLALIRAEAQRAGVALRRLGRQDIVAE
ncbi:FCD domain-containing protein [Chelatococcus asaccharovorans]|nr:FCD domain-containing protein [Chelatococcus asaccharovorans]